MRRKMTLCLEMCKSLGIKDGDLCGVVCMEVKLKWFKNKGKGGREGTLALNIRKASSGLEGLEDAESSEFPFGGD